MLAALHTDGYHAMLFTRYAVMFMVAQGLSNTGGLDYIIGKILGKPKDVTGMSRKLLRQNRWMGQKEGEWAGGGRTRGLGMAAEVGKAVGLSSLNSLAGGVGCRLEAGGKV